MNIRGFRRGILILILLSNECLCIIDCKKAGDVEDEVCQDVFKIISANKEELTADNLQLFISNIKRKSNYEKIYGFESRKILEENPNSNSLRMLIDSQNTGGIVNFQIHFLGRDLAGCGYFITHDYLIFIER